MSNQQEWSFSIDDRQAEGFSKPIDLSTSTSKETCAHGIPTDTLYLPLMLQSSSVMLSPPREGVPDSAGRFPFPGPRFHGFRSTSMRCLRSPVEGRGVIPQTTGYGSWYWMGFVAGTVSLGEARDQVCCGLVGICRRADSFSSVLVIDFDFDICDISR